MIEPLWSDEDGKSKPARFMCYLFLYSIYVQGSDRRAQAAHQLLAYTKDSFSKKKVDIASTQQALLCITITISFPKCHYMQSDPVDVTT